MRVLTITRLSIFRLETGESVFQAGWPELVRRREFTKNGPSPAAYWGFLPQFFNFV